MNNTTQNRLIVHADLKHVTIMAEIKVCGHLFQRREPMDFTISEDRFAPEICGWLEIGEQCALHEKEPMINGIYGYQRAGVVISLDDSENGLPPGLYPLRVDKQKSGE